MISSGSSSAPAIPAAPQRIDDLESLRGLAALLVVFYHMPRWNPALGIQFFQNGYLMVPLFFVLSGFVINTAYGRRITDGADFARFQFLRFGRLYPIHLLFLMVFLGIEFMKLVADRYYGLSANLPPFERNDLGAFVKNIFLISAVLPHQPTTFNYPAWSISVEFYTYAVFGLILLYLSRWRNLVFGAFVVAAMVALISDRTFGFTDLLSCFLGFFLGCLTAIVVRDRAARVPGYLPDLLAVFLVAFLVLKSDKSWDVVVYFVTAALIYAVVHARSGVVKVILNQRPLIWLGTISYSLYMSHAAVQWFVAQVVRVVFKRPQAMDERGMLVPRLDVPETMIAVGAVIALTIAVSVVCYYYIETPLREVSRRLADRIGRGAGRGPAVVASVAAEPPR